MLFGPTAAEARLARALATRLKTIFEKTDMHRQADLVRLVLLSALQF